jgi:Thioredoxin
MEWRQRYNAGMTWEQFLQGAKKNQDLWRAVYKLARVPQESVDRVRSLHGRWHLLILSEDWCGDAVNTVPLVVRLVEGAPDLDCRLLARDENPDIMDTHLTNGSRSIPLVIVLDEQYQECRWWGPRPRELQEWVLTQGLALPKEERYREVRRWYVRDRGLTTVREVVEMLERCAIEKAGASVERRGTW